MAAEVRVLAGIARSGKTTAILERYRRAIAQSTDPAGGEVLWIAPSQRAADDVRNRLLAGVTGGIFRPGIYTFSHFADAILAESDEPFSPVGALLKRQLIGRLVRDAAAEGKLEYFAPIADAPGLNDLIGSLISDLKRQHVEPQAFTAAIEGAEPSRKNRELAELYSRYEQLLANNDLYDAEGRYALACDLLRRGRLGPFARLRLAVVDGFTDFTATQHEILVRLVEKAPCLQELLVSLPLEREAGREELFWKPRRTLEDLQSRYRNLTVQWHDRADGFENDWELANLERRIFCDPHHWIDEVDQVTAVKTQAVAAEEPSPKAEVVATSGQLAEIEMLARRIKRLLVIGDDADGTKKVNPQEIAIVFRSIESNAALVQEVFDEYGIPVAIEASAKLEQSPLLQAVVGLVRLAADDWPYRQFVAVLGNNYFQPKWQEYSEKAISATQWAIRQVQVPRGRKLLMDALEWHSREQAAESETGEGQADQTEQWEHARRRQRFQEAFKLVNRLAKLLESIQRPRPLRQWIAAIDDLAEKAGMVSIAESPQTKRGIQQSAATDLDAWRSLKSALAAIDQLENRLRLPQKSIQPKKFLRLLLDVLATDPLPVESDDVGRVRVLSAQSVRGLSIPYLFLAGLSEKAFPNPQREDRIYSEAECAELNKQGLQFSETRQRGREETLLFYEAVTRATRHLVMSYPALDEKAQPLLASPILEELKRAAGKLIRQSKQISLSPLPPEGAAWSAAESRVKAVAEMIRGDAQHFGELLGSKQQAPAAANISACLRAVASRAKREFGSYEGVFVSEAAKKSLAHDFGRDHCWSVSRLEEYATCPFQFFLKNVLRLEELPGVELTTDFGKRGVLAHDALATLHRRLKETAPEKQFSQLGVDDRSKLAGDTIAVLAEKISKGSPLGAALQKINLRELAQWLVKYWEQHEKYEQTAKDFDTPPAPAYFEVSFGLARKRADKKDALSTEKPFDLRCGDEVVRLSGRIDRIDIGLQNGEVVFNVFDYKTGTKSMRLDAAAVEEGAALQLPLYALAVEELLLVDRQAKPWRIGYWQLRDGGLKKNGVLSMSDLNDGDLTDSEDWRDLRGKLLSRVLQLVSGVRGGMFPVYSLDKNCTDHCEYRTVCRIAQVRALSKQWRQDRESTAAVRVSI